VTDDSENAVQIETIRRVKADRPAVAVAFLGDTAAFVLEEADILLVAAGVAERRITVHEGALLCASSDRTKLFTGGDDGRVLITGAGGDAQCVFEHPDGRWIDHLAVLPGGVAAWSAGKQVYCRREGQPDTVIQVPSSVGGLCFCASGSLLAIAHYNGVTLCDLEHDNTSSVLDWKGSHLNVSFSPNGKVLVTAMREPTLHGWRLEDRKDLPMPSYPVRVQSMSWTADGRFLATSGSDRLTLLPFQMDDNPLAQMPLLLAPYRTLVARVACHPSKSIVAVGYDDGLVLLVRVPDGAEIMIKAPDDNSISAMQWNDTGSQLGIATASGECRCVDMAGV
jgi:WD40 repeat protein